MAGLVPAIHAVRGMWTEIPVSARAMQKRQIVIHDSIAKSRGGAMSVTRKLAAILAADVVGYSRLMGEDEAGTARAVREHREAARPIVAGFGGRIVKTTGDGLLLEFPSVVAAVECAIAIQKLMAERNAETPETSASSIASASISATC